MTNNAIKKLLNKHNIIIKIICLKKIALGYENVVNQEFIFEIVLISKYKFPIRKIVKMYEFITRSLILNDNFFFLLIVGIQFKNWRKIC